MRKLGFFVHTAEYIFHINITTENNLDIQKQNCYLPIEVIYNYLFIIFSDESTKC